MKQFIKGESYIFDKYEAIRNDIKISYENGSSKYWMDICHNLEIIIIDQLEGRIVTPEKEYIILPWWCKRIEVM